MALQEGVLRRGGADRVIGLEGEACGHLAHGHRLAAVDIDAPVVGVAGLEPQVERVLLEPLQRVAVSVVDGVYVELHDGLAAAEHAVERAHQVGAVQPHGRAADRHRHGVAGAVGARLRDAHLLRQGAGHRAEVHRQRVHAALGRQLQQPVGAVRQAALVQQRGQVFGHPLVQHAQPAQGHVGVPLRVEQPAAVGHRHHVPGQRLRVERRHEVHLAPVAGEGMVGHAHVVVRVAAHDVGVVFAVAEDVQAGRRAGAGEEAGRGIDPASLRPADPPRQVSYQFHACSGR